MAVSLPAEPNVPLVHHPVFYLGRAAPADVPDGLEAVQKPLSELYHQGALQNGFDATLTVYTNGVAADSTTSPSKWWPIQDLMECGAFRAAADGPLPFVPLATDKATKSKAQTDPVLFAMTFRRRDIPAANTWVFIAQSEEDALSLVLAIVLAHGNTAGWSSPDDRPPIAAAPPGRSVPTAAGSQMFVSQYDSHANSMFHARSSSTGNSGSKWDGGSVRAGLHDDHRKFNDYYEKPPLRGFFYAPSSSFIQKYSVSDIQRTAVPPQPIQQQPQPQIPPAPQPIQQQPQPQIPPAIPTQPIAGLLPIGPFPLRMGDAGQPNDQNSGQKKRDKKKKKKNVCFDESDSDDDGIELYTDRNGMKVAIVPEEVAVVRPSRPLQQPLLAPDPAQVWAGPDGTLWYTGDTGATPFRENYINPAVIPGYESTIVPGPGQPLLPVNAPDPFIDEGPYERRLPIGGYVNDTIPPPVSTTFGDPAAMYSSNFILRPYDGFKLPA